LARHASPLLVDEMREKGRETDASQSPIAAINLKKI
jgi:hypothetical protein